MGVFFPIIFVQFCAASKFRSVSYGCYRSPSLSTDTSNVCDLVVRWTNTLTMHIVAGKRADKVIAFPGLRYVLLKQMEGIRIFKLALIGRT